jgi:hypothetical protein
MAKLTVGNGINKYIAELERLGRSTDEIIGKCIYDGAKIVTDAVHDEIAKLPDNVATEAQKSGLISGLGIAKMKRTMISADVKVGEDGYNSHITKKFPNGHPNAMIARAIISGTSWRPQKNDFVGRAVNRTRNQAENAMKKTCEQEITKIMR